MVKGWTALAVAVAMGGAWAVPAASGSVKGGFPRPPAAAVAALNRTVGKAFNAGYVFVDGKYVKPPYVVERCGTAIRINGLYVTGEVVPWEDFIRTQEGATVTKTELPAAAETSAEPSAAESESEGESEAEAEEDDAASSLDDLFDDDPKPKKASPRKKAARKAAKPRVAKPTTVVSYSLEGGFVPNERSKALLGKINAVRTRIDSQLRAGGNYFFGVRYAGVSGNAGTSRLIMERLPELMRRNSDREAFGQGCRQAGLSAFPPSLLDDLFRNRFDYLALNERRKADQSKSQWQTLLGE